MLSVFLFVFAIAFSLGHLIYKKERRYLKIAEIILGYIIFFNIGLMGLLASYAHVFMGPQTAREIGWQPGSPFQFEIGMANLCFGVLGVMAYWIRGRFWDATCIGWSVFLLGCFVGHILDYYRYNNTAPLNYGIFIWFNDLFLPILVLGLLAYIQFGKEHHKR